MRWEAPRGRVQTVKYHKSLGSRDPSLFLLRSLRSQEPGVPQVPHLALVRNLVRLNSTDTILQIAKAYSRGSLEFRPSCNFVTRPFSAPHQQRVAPPCVIAKPPPGFHAHLNAGSVRPWKSSCASVDASFLQYENHELDSTTFITTPFGNLFFIPSAIYPRWTPTRKQRPIGQSGPLRRYGRSFEAPSCHRPSSLTTHAQELDFLLDSSLLTADQVASIHALLPSAPALPRASSAAIPTSTSPPPPTAALAATHIAPRQPSPTPSSPAAPPPAYQAASPAAPAFGHADALYAYAPTDAGDLALQPGDRVAVTAHLNDDWARGRNERSGQEGIFPRSYVRALDEKSGPPAPQPGYGYGNMPLEVAHGGGGQPPPPAQVGPVAEGQGQGQGPSKVNAQGKKFGKKLGNAGKHDSWDGWM